jgi:hypothetical protein
MTTIIAAIDPELRSLIERVDFLERDFKDDKEFVLIALPIIISIALLLWGATWKSIVDSVKGTIRKSALKAGIRELERIRAQAKEAHTEIAGAKDRILQAFEEIQRGIAPRGVDRSVSNLVIERGQFGVEFINQNYISNKTNFTSKFGSVPTVFIAESQGGQWVFAKVDQTESTRFTWAARTVDGDMMSRKTTLQWVALGELPTITPSATA